MHKVTKAMERAGMLNCLAGRFPSAPEVRMIYEAMEGARQRDMVGIERENFMAYWWFVGWHQVSLGLNISFDGPHIEIHLPFGFVRIGRPGVSTRRIIRTAK